MFSLPFTSTLLSAALLTPIVSSVDALCLPNDHQSPSANPVLCPGLSRRTVYNPEITSPTAGTTWTIGSQVTVTWDVSGIPQDHRTAKSRVVLGWIEPGELNEHLDLEHPLAQDFPVGQGQASFVVPEVQPRDNYVVVVFGDSGNHSPPFSIRAS
ncbi:putative ser-Thr-rich glycosyl-phosphatidyl-inositol-anchored membrane family protein [Lyophyllum shimeji]|uniref:Ser-Thr-rich glycosyl-phosphatidyl-inositol-anchored membrane family protein n=1 Tax=Lyophyllum shimeji TaxID=47721 RepID=A0A9P3Q1J1_LYOSH|nr:putative ser-Thr-rich glycosyl-phosphatidyl-inositol-anchored membrane family protein [Lyophyllum shimeji]